MTLRQSLKVAVLTTCEPWSIVYWKRMKQKSGKEWAPWPSISLIPVTSWGSYINIPLVSGRKLCVHNSFLFLSSFPPSLPSLDCSKIVFSWFPIISVRIFNPNQLSLDLLLRWLMKIPHALTTPRKKQALWGLSGEYRALCMVPDIWEGLRLELLQADFLIFPNLQGHQSFYDHSSLLILFWFVLVFCCSSFVLFWFGFLLLLLFWDRFSLVLKAGLEILIFKPPPHKCWNYRYVLSSPTQSPYNKNVHLEKLESQPPV
jgi:hypothetical protein